LLSSFSHNNNKGWGRGAGKSPNSPNNRPDALLAPSSLALTPVAHPRPIRPLAHSPTFAQRVRRESLGLPAGESRRIVFFVSGLNLLRITFPIPGRFREHRQRQRPGLSHVARLADAANLSERTRLSAMD